MYWHFFFHELLHLPTTVDIMIMLNHTGMRKGTIISMSSTSGVGKRKKSWTNETKYHEICDLLLIGILFFTENCWSHYNTIFEENKDESKSKKHTNFIYLSDLFNISFFLSINSPHFSTKTVCYVLNLICVGKHYIFQLVVLFPRDFISYFFFFGCRLSSFMRKSKRTTDTNNIQKLLTF